MSAAIVVQARMGSSRLPGKVAAPFGASTLLGHVLERLRRVQRADALVVATSTAPADDQVAAIAGEHGAAVFRGDEHDVLGRFAACAASLDPLPQLVVRICADRPLICPELIDELLRVHADCGAPDHLANNLRPSWPVGLDVEVVRTTALLAAAAEAVDPYDREHVTSFLYRNPQRFSVVGSDCPFGNFGGVRATIDTPVDLAALREVDRRLAAVDPQYGHEAILSLATLDPSLFPPQP